MPNFTNKNVTKQTNCNRHRNKLGYIDPTVSGIDIGAKLIHVAIPDQEFGTNVFEFGTTTPELNKIASALKNAGVITAVMEATGVYWIPLYEILEDEGLKPILVDAKSVKNVPGRKTDFVDCQWIQTLYSNGLLTAAFRPGRDQVILRSYVRQRQNNVKTRSYSLQHIEKALQLMNIKLSVVLGEIQGVSGMDIIRAIVAGEKDPVKLANLRNKRVKKTEIEFIEALTGNYQEEHLFSLKQALDHYDFADKQLVECDIEIIKQLEKYPDVVKTPIPRRDKDKKSDGKYRTAAKPKKNDLTFDVRDLLWRKSGKDFTALPGIQGSTALLIFAELGGGNVDSWSSAKKFASWLKLCPGNNISGGKSRKSKSQPCANRITQALRMAALSAKKSNTAIGAKIRQHCGRKDKLTGIKAGAHKISYMLYFMCKNGWEYHEKGEEAYEKAHQERKLKALQKRAKEFGFNLVAA